MLPWPKGHWVLGHASRIPAASSLKLNDSWLFHIVIPVLQHNDWIYIAGYFGHIFSFALNSIEWNIDVLFQISICTPAFACFYAKTLQTQLTLIFKSTSASSVYTVDNKFAKCSKESHLRAAFSCFATNYKSRFGHKIWFWLLCKHE